MLKRSVWHPFPINGEDTADDDQWQAPSPRSPMALPKTRTRDGLTNMACPEAARFLAYIRRAKARPSSKKRQPRHHVEQTVQQTRKPTHINHCIFHRL